MSKENKKISVKLDRKRYEWIKQYSEEKGIPLANAINYAIFNLEMETVGNINNNLLSNE